MFKRRFKLKVRKIGRPLSKSRKRPYRGVSSILKLKKQLQAITKTIETKSGSVEISDGTEYRHNNMYFINNTCLQTTNGTMDVENSQGQRIGDKITLSGVSFRMMLELNERYSDVTFRMMVVRSSKGDAPTDSTLWQGNSGNKMLDTLNTERFSILFQKYVKMKSPGLVTIASGIQDIGSGYVIGGATDVISRAKRIVNFLIPGKNFCRSPTRTH